MNVSRILLIIEAIVKIIALIAFLWLIFVIYSLFNGESSNDASKTKDDYKTVSTVDEEIIYTSVVDVLNEYYNNEVAADIKYDGKVVVVTGIVSEVGKSADFLTEGTPYILFSNADASNGFGTVQANFENKYQISKLANIEKGSQISVKGICNGEALYNIMLNDCYILEQ